MSEALRTLPLKITAVDGRPQVVLGDLHLENVILSGSLSVEYVSTGHGDEPQVSMTLAAGAVALDLDVDLLQHLLKVACREEARQDIERYDRELADSEPA